jgi:hypothetical protein
MPGPFVPLVVGVHILMVASSGPPRVDIRATCETSVNAVLNLGGSYSETLDSCVLQQNNAFEQIVKNWAAYPAAAKAHCVQPAVYMPSYIEWLTCFEMELDVAKLRADDAKAARAEATPPGRRSPNSRTARPCPIVQFQADGSIISVINC